MVKRKKDRGSDSRVTDGNQAMPVTLWNAPTYARLQDVRACDDNWPWRI